ncbi:MAG TPA: cupin domain-containing protein [Syntrophales bacterium]|nr:cupin domain-containing protein [Syntrophales bacterium]HOM06294.1 cupin domain-containing protein [Syntrophales bacterium]HON99267.1 cupin domain-containing protein [Syntrophales bacterium]HPC00092.1 cupin domain-containing protein [Syntrophales bacterium]HPQ05725.1 cupin domain-containing protein [Syntrophales bacterium]
MAFVDLETLEEREIAPGFRARFVHTPNVTISFWRVAAGSVLPSHRHAHEQVTNVLSGRFEMTVAGETQTAVPGMTVVIPQNAEHGGRALTDCYILDVFYPVRDDYR